MDTQTRRRVVAAFALVLLVCAATRLLAESELTEAQAKAGFLYNCALFVQWPPDVLREELLVGIMGADAVAAIADRMQGRKVNGHVLHVRAVAPGEDLRPYHIVFIGAGARVTAAQLAVLREQPVLTVGDGTDFTLIGGVVRLYTEQQRLRFEINMTTLGDAGLQMSAKMLGLAAIVR